ncbi:MAG: hypothetical protein KAR79_02725 [Simkaniaceae bacterium]|nr:hypothetical protein [Simkaniaceae bacterium]
MANPPFQVNSAPPANPYTLLALAGPKTTEERPKSPSPEDSPRLQDKNVYEWGTCKVTIEYETKADSAKNYLLQKLNNQPDNVKSSIQNPSKMETIDLLRAMQKAGVILPSEQIYNGLFEAQQAKAALVLARNYSDKSPSDAIDHALIHLGFVDTANGSYDDLLAAECTTRGEKTDTEHKIQVAHSVAARVDYTAKIKFNDEESEIFSTDHESWKNSSMNGKCYTDANGDTVFIQNASASSNDRKAKELLNARIISSNDGRAIAYTGRPDSLERAKEQATMIFLNELHSGKNQGLKEEGGSYTQTYLVNSLLTPNVRSPERTFTLNEQKALKELRNEPLEIQDPKTGITHKVHFKPIFFCTPFNIVTQGDDIAPDYLSGKRLSETISEKGYEMLGEAHLAHIGPKLHPEIELLKRIQLAKKMNLPVVLHCKSSVDRTAIAAAIAAAFDQCERAGIAIFANKEETEVTEEFKELFFANGMANHPVTAMTRGAVGPVDGTKLELENFGYEWGKRWMTNPQAARLAPEEFLEDAKVIEDFIKPNLPKFSGKNVVIAVVSPLIAAIGIIALLLITVYGCIRPLVTTRPGDFNPFIVPKAIYHFKDLLPEKKWKESHKLHIDHQIYGKKVDNLKAHLKAVK